LSSRFSGARQQVGEGRQQPARPHSDVGQQAGVDVR